LIIEGNIEENIYFHVVQILVQWQNNNEVRFKYIRLVRNLLKSNKKYHSSVFCKGVYRSFQNIIHHDKVVMNDLSIVFEVCNDVCQGIFEQHRNKPPSVIGPLSFLFEALFLFRPLFSVTVPTQTQNIFRV